MDLSNLEELFGEAKRLTGHGEFVVVGSLSALGIVQDGHVPPRLPTLPAQWEYRLIRVPLNGGLTVFFLDPNDAAVSKYARGEPRDREWLQAGLAAGLLSAPVIASRFRETIFLDDEERQRALWAFAEDT